MASNKPEPMQVDAKRGSGLPRAMTGKLALDDQLQTIEAQIAGKADLANKTMEKLAARERALLNLAKGTSRGSRGSDKTVPSRLPHGLTLKQEQFCQNIIAGMTHAQAYRDAYDCHNLKPAVVYQRAYAVKLSPRVKRRLEELWAIREARLSHTPAELRLFVQERLMVEALNPENSGSVRVRAVELIGKMGKVALFEADKEESQENQSVDAILKRIKPLLDTGNALAKQVSKSESPMKSRHGLQTIGNSLDP
jgi:hypothetical protein